MKNMLKVAVIIFTFSFVFELPCMAKENGIKNIAVSPFNEMQIYGGK